MQVSQASVTQDLFSCCVLCPCSKYEKSETELSLPQSLIKGCQQKWGCNPEWESWAECSRNKWQQKDMSSKGYTEAEVIIDRCLNTHLCVATCENTYSRWCSAHTYQWLFLFEIGYSTKAEGHKGCKLFLQPLKKKKSKHLRIYHLL